MKTARARCGDAVLLSHLRDLTGTGRVDTAFRHVLNLLLPGGRLMALASRQADNAPWTLVVDVPDWTSAAVEPGQAVEFAPGALATAGLSIDTTGAGDWDPPPLSVSVDELGPATAALDRLVRTQGTPGGMVAAARPSPMEAALRDGRDALVRAVLAADPDGVRRGVLGLLGLGPGLTPAGDDFLTGLALLSSLSGSRLGLFAGGLREVLAVHAGRTTLLSSTTLAEALDGRVRASLLDLLSAMARHDLAPAHRVLAIGHTSGTDTLSGLVTGLHLERELRGSL
ncbi:DUF2877 domain-containing protein [Nonomuraea sp. NPDC059194]|uniref:oxamate carbamoyltransferase subunit AllH family protein n=1 Tax=Nonomuraea sp. NPDC059194 TaxID=3346764 RepID=UPI00368FC9EB